MLQSSPSAEHTAATAIDCRAELGMACWLSLLEEFNIAAHSNTQQHVKNNATPSLVGLDVLILGLVRSNSGLSLRGGLLDTSLDGITQGLVVDLAVQFLELWARAGR